MCKSEDLYIFHLQFLFWRSKEVLIHFGNKSHSFNIHLFQGKFIKLKQKEGIGVDEIAQNLFQITEDSKLATGINETKIKTW